MFLFLPFVGLDAFSFSSSGFSLVFLDFLCNEEEKKIEINLELNFRTFKNGQVKILYQFQGNF